METAVGNAIDSFGSIVTVVTQTATTGADEYHQTANRWAASSTSQAHAYIRPPSSKTPFGEEFHKLPMGAFQEADYWAWFEATWTLEETQTGTTTLTHTRYKIVLNNTDDYEITQIKPWEFQNNIFMKTCALKLINV